MSLFFKIIGVLIFGSSVIMGFVSGSKASELAIMLNAEEGFRFGIALIWWLSGIISGSVFFAIGIILEKVEENNKYLRELLHRNSSYSDGEKSPHSDFPNTTKNKSEWFRKVYKNSFFIYGIISIFVLATLGFFILMDFSGPGNVAAKFITNVKQGEYKSAHKYMSDKAKTEYSESYLRNMRDKYKDGVTYTGKEKLTLTGDSAVQIVDYTGTNQDNTSIPIYLKKTFWGWKIIDVE